MDRIKNIIIGVSFIVLVLLTINFLTGCDGMESSGKATDIQETKETEMLMSEASRQFGMPNITHFYEKKIAKEIYELRDDSSLITYAYFQNQMTGKLIYLGKCIGFGLPYSVQYSNPSKIWDLEKNGGAINKFDDNGEIQVMPQAEPNGLFMPEGLSATWLMYINEETGDTEVIYTEPNIIVTQSKLPSRLVETWSLPTK
jgi:hypothetical protein